MRLLPGDACERWRAERDVLDALPPRPNLLMQNTLDFVARFPSDPRASRLLRQTVHATRLDHCGDASAGELSKKAFNLLKRHYGQTEEARPPRHWFKPGYRAGRKRVWAPPPKRRADLLVPAAGRSSGPVATTPCGPRRDVVAVVKRYSVKGGCSYQQGR